MHAPASAGAAASATQLEQFPQRILRAAAAAALRACRRGATGGAERMSIAVDARVTMNGIADRLYRLSQTPAAAAWAVAASAAAMLAALARLLLLVASAAQLPVADPGRAPARIARVATAAPIAGWHLFGVPGDALQEAATTLALTLRGTFASNVPGHGMAYIADAGGHQLAYRAGDALPGGGVLQAVHADRVLILNNGRRETLALRDEHRAQAAPDAGAADRARPAPVSTAPSVAGAPRTDMPVPAPGGVLRAAGLAALADRANVLPVVENGRVVGARISVPDVALLERLGLRRDDVIVAVNGTDIDKPGLGPLLQDSLRAGGAVGLTVRRGGQTLRIDVQP